MLLDELFESKISGKNVSSAMTKIISYLERQLGAKFRKLGVEHFKNSFGEGTGLRYVEDGTLNCIRFNWIGSRSSEIVSVDLWNGTKHDPNFNVTFKGVSLAKSLPELVKVLKAPKIGKVRVSGGEVALAEGKGLSPKLGARVQFNVYNQWKRALPKNAKLTGQHWVELRPGDDGEPTGPSTSIEIANAEGKDFIGVAGKFDHNKVEGWIYEYYLNKDNLKEGIATLDFKYVPEQSTKTVAVFKDKHGQLHQVNRKDLPEDHPNKKPGIKESMITEVKKGEFTPESAVADMVKKLEAGRSFNRSEFIVAYHVENAHAYDEFVEQHEDELVIQGKRISLPKGAKLGSPLASSGDAGELVVSKGASGEEYEVDVPEPDRVSFSDSLEHLEGLTTGIINGAFNALFVAGRGGTGKTQTVEDTLAENGLTDGAGYYKITGSASPIGMYSALYKNRDGVILFDDCDGALESQDGRNIIKAATDTKKIRKIAWGKKSAGMYDPEDRKTKDIPQDDEGGEDGEGETEDSSDLPRWFNFTGRVIFISNLPLNKLDPDGALRTRAFIISIDPTPEEIFERMGEIVNDIKLEAGSLSAKQRQEVLEIVKTSKNAKNASLRTLVRALGLAASGAPNWENLVRLYA